MEIPQKVPPPLDGDNNGYEAWLRYSKEVDPKKAARVRDAAGTIFGPVPEAAKYELELAIRKITGTSPSFKESRGRIHFVQVEDEEGLGNEGYIVRTSGTSIEVRANTQAGLLYGTFRLLAEWQLGREKANFLETIPHLAEHFTEPATVERGVYRTPHQPGSSCRLK
jgi:alpha-glucuronidase